MSKEFAKSSHSNGIRTVRDALNNPSSNGAIESFIQTFKRIMKTMAKEEEKTGTFSVIVLENTTGHDLWRLQQCC